MSVIASTVLTKGTTQRGARAATRTARGKFSTSGASRLSIVSKVRARQPAATFFSVKAVPLWSISPPDAVRAQAVPTHHLFLQRLPQRSRDDAAPTRLRLQV